HPFEPIELLSMTLNRQCTRLLSKAFLPLFAIAACKLEASENAPHTPFAEWANMPDPGHLVVRATYQESESYYFWAGNQRFKVDTLENGEHHGIDINQGYFSLQYGLNYKWAIDISLGFTTSGWRFFDEGGEIQSTTGVMDPAFGVRYQIFKEGDEN